jgi:putative FmdB family regulatory protein
MTYEYICTACGYQWEAEQSITADPLKDCPHCSEPRAKRQVSGGAGFILRGGGWYADGYGSKPATKSDGDGKTEAPSADSAKKSSDAKPDSTGAESTSAKKDAGSASEGSKKSGEGSTGDGSKGKGQAKGKSAAA